MSLRKERPRKRCWNLNGYGRMMMKVVKAIVAVAVIVKKNKRIVKLKHNLKMKSKIDLFIFNN